MRVNLEIHKLKDEQFFEIQEKIRGKDRSKESNQEKFNQAILQRLKDRLKQCNPNKMKSETNDYET